jgi:hypothetical protein
VVAVTEDGHVIISKLDELLRGLMAEGARRVTNKGLAGVLETFCPGLRFSNAGQ